MSDIPFTIVQLPQHLQEDIVNRLEDAVHIASVKCVCKSFQNAANRARSLRIICKEEYHTSIRRIRDEEPKFVLPAIKRPTRGGAQGTMSSSQAAASDSALSIQKTEKNDVTPVETLPATTQTSTDTGNGKTQEYQNDSGISKCPQQDKVAEERMDASHEVPSRIDIKGPSQHQEEDQSDVKICNRQQPSNQNGSNQALRKTSRNFLTHKEDQQETLKGQNGNFLDGHKKKLKLEFRARDFQAREGASISPMTEEEEECDTSKGHTQADNGNFTDVRSKKPKLEGEFLVGCSHSVKASALVRKEEQATYKGHLQETPGDDNGGNLQEGSSSKQPKLEGEFCAEDLEDGDTTTLVTSKEPINFRHIVPTILRETECVAQLRLEIEPKLQSKVVPESERRLYDHWLTDPLFVKRWIPSIQSTIQNLCIVDYGQQAIMRRSSLLKELSETCFALKTLDLRNMFLDMKGCKNMPCLTSFTLRCVKVQGDALQEINARMRNLQTLALLGVFGVQEGHFTFPELKVLCLGLSTKAKLVKVELPKLVKLQLKMSCPEVLHIFAPTLKFVAFNLEILDCSLVGFENLHNLQELLYGSSNFMTLSKLVRRNVLLDKMFLDIPCMALGEDGKWLGVLKEVLLDVPPFERLQSECPNLQVLNVGPGLWHSMEIAPYSSLVGVRAWPPITRLILHMIPHTLTTSVAVLLLFITVMHKLQVLEVKVHTNSEVDYDSFIDAIKSHVAHLHFRHGKWTKSLDFSCFSF